jgi:hypothetical protein
MAMSTFNTVRITRRSTLLRKKLISSWMWSIYTKNIYTASEEKLDQTNKHLAYLLESNIWFSSKVTDAIEKKFQSVVHHHKNVVKSAQHNRLAPGALPHDVLDGIINHIVQVAKKKNLVPFVRFASDLFQIEVSHLYTPAANEFTLILHIPMVANSNLLNLFKFLPLPIHFNLHQISRSHLMSTLQTYSQLAIHNLFKQFPALTYTLTSTLGTHSFAKGGKSWK